MEAKHGPWYFKQNEDGIFVKLNEERVKNSKASLMEQVLDVKESASRGRESDHVVVSHFISQSSRCKRTSYLPKAATRYLSALVLYACLATE